MIFLLKDGTCKVHKSTPMNDQKTLKLYRKYQSDLAAVLIESNTRLHSDLFIIVEPEHFKTHIEPFEATYRIGLACDDEPIELEDTIERMVVIDNIYDYYNFIALIHQIDKTSDSISPFDSITGCIALLSLTIKTRGEERLFWDPDSETAHEFLERQDMIIDTDHFLDASVPRADMVEEGAYIQKYDRKSGYQTLNYYYHAARFYLQIKNLEWHRVKALPIDLPDMNEGFEAYGMCLNDCGVIYMAPKPIAILLTQAQECESAVYYGKWETYENITEAVIDSDDSGTDYEAYDISDILYMALYLPQLLDLINLLYHRLAVKVYVRFLFCRHFEKSGSYTIPAPKNGEGIKFDLFSVLSSIIIQEPVDITIDE